MSVRPSVPYDNPNTVAGLLGRWYPLVVPIVIILIGPEIGAMFTGFDSALGRPAIPYVYTPIDLWHWFGSMSAGNALAGPAQRAVNIWFGMMLLGYVFVIAQMFIDFLHGRNWGPVNYLLIAMSWWSDLSRIMEGFPPSLTWWGPGGTASVESAGVRGTRTGGLAASRAREPYRNEPPAGGRAFIAVLWDLRRFVVAVCLLAFGSYQLYLAFEFHTERRLTYADFAKTLPSAGWYRITGVPLDYGFALPHRDQKGLYGRYIPAIVPGAGGISLLVFADDRTEPVKGKVAQTKDVDGMVETLFENSTSVDADLKPYGAALNKQYRIIDEGETPHVLLGVILGIVGILIGLLLTLAGIGYIFDRGDEANKTVPSKA